MGKEIEFHVATSWKRGGSFVLGGRSVQFRPLWIHELSAVRNEAKFHYGMIYQFEPKQRAYDHCCTPGDAWNWWIDPWAVSGRKNPRKAPVGPISVPNIKLKRTTGPSSFPASRKAVGNDATSFVNLPVRNRQFCQNGFTFSLSSAEVFASARRRSTAASSKWSALKKSPVFKSFTM